MLRLKDVADVEFGNAYYDLYSKLNGKPSAAIVIKQSYGSNASEVIKNIKLKLEDIKKTSFPKGMDYQIGYDVSTFLDASIEKVVHTLVEAFLLVSLVVFLFLADWRSTLIPAIAVPVSLIGTFFFMQLFGITLNLITLFALVLAIGIVVDDAIVVVEAVHAKMEEFHCSPLEATKMALKEIGGAIIAITLVMAAVFIPVSFMSGPVGIFYRQFSVTMATAIILSGIVALTFTPALCAMMLKNTHGKPKRKTILNRFLTGFNNWFNKLNDKYKKFVGAIVNRRVVTFVTLVLFCVGTWGISSKVPSGFIPNEDQGLFYAIILTPPGSTLERTDDVALQLQRVAATIPEIKSVSTMSGYEILSEGTGANSGSCLINLKDWSERKRSLNEIMKDLEEKAQNIKGASIEFFPPPAVPGYGAAGGFEFGERTRTCGERTAFCRSCGHVPDRGDWTDESRRTVERHGHDGGGPHSAHFGATLLGRGDCHADLGSGLQCGGYLGGMGRGCGDDRCGLRLLLGSNARRRGRLEGRWQRCLEKLCFRRDGDFCGLVPRL
jgi:HAE1 family hydrophobic/amphiphilic exporter-1